MDSPVTIIGGGLAGCEAAWQIARRGGRVRLYEMRPVRTTPAHSTEKMAELVCSNSFRSDQRSNAVGLLHEEMRRMGSLILEVADTHRVPAGKALAVDRSLFAGGITERIESEPRIEVVREEVTHLPDALAIVATGPLTSDALAEAIGVLCGDALYFYDSISPIVYQDSLDLERMFRASRYEEGEGDYLNIPLSRDEYYAFVEEVRRAEKVPLHRFEHAHYFEACLPIEVMVQRGPDTLAFGPMKPVGLVDPRTGGTAFAVLQLRQEDKTGEQKRILKTLPGMENAVFARFGSVHRNTFVRSPGLLTEHLEHRERPGLFFAGQIVGVEGYVESAAMGLLAGIHVAFRATGGEAPLPPPMTALGSLLRYLKDAKPRTFQPMNVNFGLFPPLERRGRIPRRERNERMAERALEALEPYRQSVAPEAA
jgi:methylenetetrahydrofolate--tRNA-(uracil-5-)-methyltransferase